MAILLALFLNDLPLRLQDQLEEESHLQYGWTVETRALWTGFDNDLRIEDAAGQGLQFGMFSQSHGSAVFGLHLAACAWETVTEDDEVKPADVRVRQYLFGMGYGGWEGDFEFSLRLDFGGITYSGGGERDAAGLGQIGLEAKFLLLRNVNVGVLAQVAFTHADFNRGSEHAVVNPSIGLTLGVRF